MPDGSHKKIDYDFAAHEAPIFKDWNDKGYFKRSKGWGENANKTYTIVIPPPNVTGVLHMGHALNDTIQDTCTRRARMMGYQARWIIGTDHAGIATQTKVDKKLAEEGISRLEIGREKFIEACYDWRNEYGTTIVNQIKGMGCSCDYSDEHFTLDESYAKAVRKVFVDWYHDGLIYRGKRIVNWCPSCTTAIADDEAEYVDEAGKLWYLRYPLVEPVDGVEYIVVATTRPETMLGDTGVAVNPKDERFASLVGKKIMLPLVNREIPIFADWHVDASFGTGCVKVTPSHDPNDWAMGQSAGLPRINVFDETAHVVEGYGEFSGMDRDEARVAIVDAFDKLGLLDHIEDHDHSVMTCYRCHTKLEPWESEQWFVAVDKLKEDAARVVKDGEIQFHPARWSQVYLDWLENLKDWCISRQLWWGHRIPMYYCDECGWEDASEEDLKTCPKCGHELRQDEDVLDTWFSSALWPFSTLGWPEETEDYKRYYPTSTMVTGYDIIFFWVARMAFDARHFTNNRPFKDVLIHGLIRDAQGRKMSKSLGNGIDPMQVIDEYGVDALRFFLTTNSTPGQDMRYIPEKVEAAWNFINKIWNASRFVLMNLPEGMSEKDVDLSYLTPSETWILNKLNATIDSVTANMEKYEFALVGNELYSFVWNDFCSWYVEMSKSALNGDDEKAKKGAQSTLYVVLNAIVRLLSPFMPFVCDEIYQTLPHTEESICLETWPSKIDGIDDSNLKDMDRLISAISKIREVKNTNDLKPSAPIHVLLKDLDGNVLSVDTGLSAIMQKMCKAEWCDSLDGDLTVETIYEGTLYIPSSELSDPEEEKKKLNAEKERLEKELDRSHKMLSNQSFIAKAPEAKVQAEKDKLAGYEKQYQAIVDRLAVLNH